MFSRLTLTQKALFWPCLLLIAQASCLLAVRSMQLRSDRGIQQALNTQSMVSELNRLSNVWKDAAVDFVNAELRWELRNAFLSNGAASLHDQFGELNRIVLTSGTEADKADVREMEKNTRYAAHLLQIATDALMRGDRKLYKSSFAEVASRMQLCARQSDALLDRLLTRDRASFIALQNASNQKTILIFLVLILDVAISVGIAFLFIESTAKKIEQIQDNTRRLVAEVPLHPLLEGVDEVAVLDRTFQESAARLKESERRERAAIDTVRDLICILSPEGVFTALNHASNGILGYLPVALIGTPILNIVLPSDRQKVNTHLQSLVQGRLAESFEMRVLRKNHTVADLLVSAHWSESDKAIFCVVHDVTQRRQIQRMKKQLVSMITHDLRSPLTNVGLTLEMLSGGVYDPQSEQGIRRINEANRSIAMMLQLIAELLEMEKFDTSTIEYSMAPVEVAAMVEEAVGSVAALAERQGITIEMNVEPAVVSADRFRIVQVLVNLLSNAIKFSPNKSVIAVSGRVSQSNLRLEIKDSGKGISAEDQRIIFEPFKQASQSTSAERLQGTGLGLAVCKSIVEAHEGTIGVLSDGVGKGGSTFWFELPVRLLSAESQSRELSG